MSFLIDKIREQKLIEMDVNLDKFIEENKISEKSMIYQMILDKSVFKDAKEVTEYLRDKHFWEAKVTETGDEFIADIVSVNQMDMDTDVVVELRRGVIAKAADFIPVPLMSDELMFNEKGEINLSSKFETINLNDGLPYIIEISRVAEGEHPSYGKIKITEDHLKEMVKNFEAKVTGVDLAINEDHRKNEAFGWFKDVFLSFDKQTLYGQVQWNSKGTQALSEKEYRYFSPEFRFNYQHPHTGMEHGATLMGGALTNYPFLKMEAITQLNNKNEGDQVETIDLKIHTDKVVELSTKLSAVQIELNEKTSENKTLATEVKVLKETIELNAKKSAHEKLFTEGHINAAQLKAMNEGKGLVEILSLNEKVNLTPTGVVAKVTTEIQLSEEEKYAAQALGLTDEEMKATEL